MATLYECWKRECADCGKTCVMRHVIPKSRVIQYELVGFLLIFIGVILDDIVAGFSIVSLLHGLIEAVLVLITAIPILLITNKLVKRLYYLEGFFKMCAWCRYVDDGNNNWITIEQLMEKKFHVATTHSACPRCLAKLKAEMNEDLIA